LEFVIVDVETTHGDPMQGSIIEVAVIVHDGLRELDRWNTLVNTRTVIPHFIQRLTGITPRMIEGAPPFVQVAQSLRASTADRIMVAHNVRYDMTALQHELARTGLSYHPDTLCTERLARQLVPNLTYYNLGSLCRHLGITRGHEHRAAHDAQATLALLLRLIEDHGQERVLATMVPWSEKQRA
jgi:DNA polymerase-3 subunit epsilon